MFAYGLPTFRSFHYSVLSHVFMNAPTLCIISLVLLLNSVSKASLFAYLKRSLEDIEPLFNSRHTLVSILFPEPAEAQNITIKLGFIGALDKSLGATASLGQELVSSVFFASSSKLVHFLPVLMKLVVYLPRRLLGFVLLEFSV